jgi:hypothetical protein
MAMVAASAQSLPPSSRWRGRSRRTRTSVRRRSARPSARRRSLSGPSGRPPAFSALLDNKHKKPRLKTCRSRRNYKHLKPASTRSRSVQSAPPQGPEPGNAEPHDQIVGDGVRSQRDPPLAPRQLWALVGLRGDALWSRFRRFKAARARKRGARCRPAAVTSGRVGGGAR